MFKKFKLKKTFSKIIKNVWQNINRTLKENTLKKTTYNCLKLELMNELKAV